MGDFQNITHNQTMFFNRAIVTLFLSALLLPSMLIHREERRYEHHQRQLRILPRWCPEPRGSSPRMWKHLKWWPLVRTWNQMSFQRSTQLSNKKEGSYYISYYYQDLRHV